MQKKCPKAAVVGFQAGFGRASSPGTHISMGLRAWFFVSHPSEEDKETSAVSAWLMKAMYEARRGNLEAWIEIRCFAL